MDAERPSVARLDPAPVGRCPGARPRGLRAHRPAHHHRGKHRARRGDPGVANKVDRRWQRLEEKEARDEKKSSGTKWGDQGFSDKSDKHKKSVKGPASDHNNTTLGHDTASSAYFD